MLCCVLLSFGTDSFYSYPARMFYWPRTSETIPRNMHAGIYIPWEFYESWLINTKQMIISYVARDFYGSSMFAPVRTPRAPFTNMDYLWFQHEKVITSLIKCGMKLLIHFQTSTVASLKFGNVYIFPPILYWTCKYLSMLVLKLIHVNKRALETCIYDTKWIRK